MEKNEIRDFISEVLNKNTVVPYEQIPDIDLYMDQLTTFIEDKLKGYKRYHDDKVLTKTMINNYTKDGVLPPPERKKYNREQIALLILIYHMKAGITINDISTIFDAVEEYKFGVENFYKSFYEIQKKEIAGLGEQLKKKFADIDSSTQNDDALKLWLILTLIAESNSKKLLAERLIDKLFSKKVYKSKG